MPLAISPVTPALAANAADLGVALQPGTVVDARVLKLLDANLVRIAIAGLTFDVPTTQPFQQAEGQTLQLAVAQAADGLSLTPVRSDAGAPLREPAVIVETIPLAPRSPAQPPATALSAPEAEAVAAAAQEAVTRQAGLSPLFADLSVAVQSGKLPQPVLAAAAQLLGLRVPGATRIGGDDIKAALQASGLVFEASLAAPARTGVPDIKSALLVLRHSLATWLPQDADAAGGGVPGKGSSSPSPAANPAASAAPSDVGPARAATVVQVAAAVEALAGPSLQNALQGTPKNLLAAQILASALREPVPAGLSEPPSQAVPPPLRGAPPAAQAVAMASLAPDAEPSTIARHLAAETDSAVARQTLLQIASLPDRADLQNLRTDPAQPRWNFEIPFVTPQGTAMAQCEVARDGGGTEIEAARRTWRARFSIDIEPAGPVHALISFAGETTAVKMWAERPATAAQLRANAFQLTQSLDRADVKTGDIVVADGAPMRPRVSSGQFLNRAT